MDSPDRNAFGFPVDTTSYKDKELTVKMAEAEFVYVGKLGEDNVITGAISFQPIGITWKEATLWYAERLEG